MSRSIKKGPFVDPKLLKKVMKARKKYNAHDEENRFKIGDKVTIRESRPFSKNKKFEVVGENK